MIPVDLYLDFTPVHTEQLLVADGAGSPLAAGWGLPPLAAGADVLFQPLGDDGSGFVFCGDVAQTTSSYDLDLAWHPTVWNLELDFGVRAAMPIHTTLPLVLSVDGGSGLYAAVLAQPWWQDFGYVGLGAHLGVTATFGAGRVRPLIGVRGSATLAPGQVQGGLDSAVEDVTWTFNPTNARIGVHAGIALR